MSDNQTCYVYFEQQPGDDRELVLLSLAAVNAFFSQLYFRKLVVNNKEFTEFVNEKRLLLKSYTYCKIRDILGEQVISYTHDKNESNKIKIKLLKKGESCGKLVNGEQKVLKLTKGGSDKYEEEKEHQYEHRENGVEDITYMNYFENLKLSKEESRSRKIGIQVYWYSLIHALKMYFTRITKVAKLGSLLNFKILDEDNYTPLGVATLGTAQFRTLTYELLRLGKLEFFFALIDLFDLAYVFGSKLDQRFRCTEEDKQKKIIPEQTTIDINEANKPQEGPPENNGKDEKAEEQLSERSNKEKEVEKEQDLNLGQDGKKNEDENPLEEELPVKNVMKEDEKSQPIPLSEQAAKLIEDLNSQVLPSESDLKDDQNSQNIPKKDANKKIYADFYDFMLSHVQFGLLFFRESRYYLDYEAHLDDLNFVRLFCLKLLNRVNDLYYDKENDLARKIFQSENVLKEFTKIIEKLDKPSLGEFDEIQIFELNELLRNNIHIAFNYCGSTIFGSLTGHSSTKIAQYLKSNKFKYDPTKLNPLTGTYGFQTLFLKQLRNYETELMKMMEMARQIQNDNKIDFNLEDDFGFPISYTIGRFQMLKKLSASQGQQIDFSINVKQLNPDPKTTILELNTDNQNFINKKSKLKAWGFRESGDVKDQKLSEADLKKMRDNDFLYLMGYNYDQAALKLQAFKFGNGANNGNKDLSFEQQFIDDLLSKWRNPDKYSEILSTLFEMDQITNFQADLHLFHKVQNDNLAQEQEIIDESKLNKVAILMFLQIRKGYTIFGDFQSVCGDLNCPKCSDLRVKNKQKIEDELLNNRLSIQNDPKNNERILLAQKAITDLAIKPAFASHLLQPYIDFASQQKIQLLIKRTVEGKTIIENMIKGIDRPLEIFQQYAEKLNINIDLAEEYDEVNHYRFIDPFLGDKGTTYKLAIALKDSPQIFNQRDEKLTIEIMGQLELYNEVKKLIGNKKEYKLLKAHYLFDEFKKFKQDEDKKLEKKKGEVNKREEEPNNIDEKRKEEMKQKLIEAKIICQEVIKADKNQSDAHNTLALIYKQENKILEAIYRIDSAIDIKRDNSLYRVNLVDMLIDYGSYKRALEMIEYVLNQDNSTLKPKERDLIDKAFFVQKEALIKRDLITQDQFASIHKITVQVIEALNKGNINQRIYEILLRRIRQSYQNLKIKKNDDSNLSEKIVNENKQIEQKVIQDLPDKNDDKGLSDQNLIQEVPEENDGKNQSEQNDGIESSSEKGDQVRSSVKDGFDKILEKDAQVNDDEKDALAKAEENFEAYLEMILLEVEKNESLKAYYYAFNQTLKSCIEGYKILAIAILKDSIQSIGIKKDSLITQYSKSLALSAGRQDTDINNMRKVFGAIDQIFDQIFPNLAKISLDIKLQAILKTFISDPRRVFDRDLDLEIANAALLIIKDKFINPNKENLELNRDIIKDKIQKVIKEILGPQDEKNPRALEAVEDVTALLCQIFLKHKEVNTDKQTRVCMKLKNLALSKDELKDIEPEKIEQVVPGASGSKACSIF